MSRAKVCERGTRSGGQRATAIIEWQTFKADLREIERTLRPDPGMEKPPRRPGNPTIIRRPYVSRHGEGGRKWEPGEILLRIVSAFSINCRGLTPPTVFCHHFLPTVEPPQASARPSCDGTSRDQEKGGPAVPLPEAPTRLGHQMILEAKTRPIAVGRFLPRSAYFLSTMPSCATCRDFLGVVTSCRIGLSSKSSTGRPWSIIPHYGENPRSPLKPYGLRGSSGSRVPTS